MLTFKNRNTQMFDVAKLYGGTKEFKFPAESGGEITITARMPTKAEVFVALQRGGVPFTDDGTPEKREVLEDALSNIAAFRALGAGLIVDIEGHKGPFTDKTPAGLDVLHADYACKIPDVVLETIGEAMMTATYVQPKED